MWSRLAAPHVAARIGPLGFGPTQNIGFELASAQVKQHMSETLHVSNVCYLCVCHGATLQRCGCGSKPMVPFWGRCTAHFSLFQWGLCSLVRAFDPWPCGFFCQTWLSAPGGGFDYYQCRLSASAEHTTQAAAPASDDKLWKLQRDSLPGRAERAVIAVLFGCWLKIDGTGLGFVPFTRAIYFSKRPPMGAVP